MAHSVGLPMFGALLVEQQCVLIAIVCVVGNYQHGSHCLCSVRQLFTSVALLKFELYSATEDAAAASGG
jgi:hypothetical protein